MSRLFIAATLLAGALISLNLARVLADDEPPEFARWESAIAAFEEQDRRSPLVTGGVLFVGSSSIRLWDLDRHFPGLGAINRGFGGSQVADSVHFADRVVLPYAPRTIVMYAGDNDIDAGKSPCAVYKDFQQFVALVHDKLPETRIIYIAIKPSLKRWKLVHRMRAANALIAASCVEDERLEFIDIDAPMLGEDGQPRGELFIEDGLHLSPAGYKLWSDLVRPHVK